MNPDFNILYVNDLAISTRFYTELFDLQPEEGSPTFTMFRFSSNTALGLKSVHSVEPEAMSGGSGGEMGFTMEHMNAVDSLYAKWTQRGLKIIQAPVHMNYGYTFVATDPDGYRIRVFTPAQF
ncbi:VOC family protein [uncultured Legionella sp.]|uniref:VOC family protein n=1 Tax=uncultured Legionella sp. TaxID=210934 RepID=UPI002605C0E6|nr:VOC family protein [uncultured Legionella sp.]